jgi:triosephosphate isomerase
MTIRRRPLIAANWKMHKTISEAVAFASQLRPALPSLPDCDLVLIPSFFGVRPLADALAGTPVAVGAQDLHWEDRGAFTGEVSASMLRDAGASVVLVGHSERRHLLGEANEVVARKHAAALRAGLTPILCVGETLAEREAGRERAVVEAQLAAVFAEGGEAGAKQTVIAYEPVWAIGTGRTASPDDAEEMHRAVRSWFGSRFGAAMAARLRVQYGGSVKAENAASLLGRPEIDGLLVGGASLDASSFVAIARAAGAARPPGPGAG